MFKSKFAPLSLSIGAVATFASYAQENIDYSVVGIEKEIIQTQSEFNDEKIEGYEFDDEYSSTVEISNDSISIFSTGISLSAKIQNGFGTNFNGSINGEIDETGSEDFKLGKLLRNLMQITK